jgi:hypothetical protein
MRYTIADGTWRRADAAGDPRRAANERRQINHAARRGAGSTGPPDSPRGVRAGPPRTDPGAVPDGCGCLVPATCCRPAYCSGDCRWQTLPVFTPAVRVNDHPPEPAIPRPRPTWPQNRYVMRVERSHCRRGRAYRRSRGVCPGGRCLGTPGLPSLRPVPVADHAQLAAVGIAAGLRLLHVHRRLGNALTPEGVANPLTPAAARAVRFLFSRIVQPRCSEMSDGSDRRRLEARHTYSRRISPYGS